MDVIIALQRLLNEFQKKYGEVPTSLVVPPSLRRKMMYDHIVHYRHYVSEDGYPDFFEYRHGNNTLSIKEE